MVLVMRGLDPKVLTWDDITSAVSRVVEAITGSGYEVEVVVGILRGGVVPAVLIADRLGVKDIGTMDIKFYEAPGVTGKEPYLRQPLTLTIRGRSVLVVDDISDTGLTLQAVLDIVRHYAPRSVRTATLYVKPWTKLVPDYYAVVTEDWIVFPWDFWEHRRLVESPDLEASQFLMCNISEV
jgi:hypoxanthine phosphoribosyltransferase